MAFANWVQPNTAAIRASFFKANQRKVLAASNDNFAVRSFDRPAKLALFPGRKKDMILLLTNASNRPDQAAI